jgi:cholesterol oxidase
VKYDLPAAIRDIRSKINPDSKIHIIAHCIGSVAMSAALASEQITGISSFISNSVSFTPQVPKIAAFKLKIAPFFLDNIFKYPYLSPQIPYMPGNSFAKWLSVLQNLFRKECKEPACHMASFMWGWGFPAPYQHKNLHPLTHKRIKDLFGATTTYYYRHISKMISCGESIPFDRKGDFYHLPKSYLQELSKVLLPPTLFIAGNENKIFPGSNKKSFEEIKKINPLQNIHFQEIDGYGHQDIFIGKNSAIDVFPTMIDFLNKHRS